MAAALYHAPSSESSDSDYDDESDDYGFFDDDADYRWIDYEMPDFMLYGGPDFSTRPSRQPQRSRPSAQSKPVTKPAPTPPPPVVLCRFFVLGKCRYGSRCSYSHTLPPAVSSERASEPSEQLSAAAALVDCPFFLRGKCKFGDFCRLRHSTVVSSPANAAAAVANATPASTSNQTVEATSSTSTAQAAAAEPVEGQQQEFTCGICFEDIVECGKQFGLLSKCLPWVLFVSCADGVTVIGCDHCYCLDCLRSWRQSKGQEVEVIRSCPACRVPSNYIVPSLTFCTGEAKEKLVAAYKSHLSVRECKYFTGQLGSCPFGPHCFYAHRDSEGRDVKHRDHQKRTRRGYRRGNNRSRMADDATASTLLSSYSQLFHFLESFHWDEYDGHDFEEELHEHEGWD